jgi:hypothetical protein
MDDERSDRGSGTWPVFLVAAAAVGRADGGAGLQTLVHEAGFATKPLMSIVVRRSPPRVDIDGRPMDPLVDDVINALRSLCA